MKNDLNSDITYLIQVAFASLQDCIETLKDNNFEEEAYEHLKDYYLALCAIVQKGPLTVSALPHWKDVSYLSRYIINSEAMFNCRLGSYYTDPDPNLNIGRSLNRIATKMSLCSKVQYLDPAEASYILSEVQANISWLSSKYLDPLYNAYAKLLDASLDYDDFSEFFLLIEEVEEEEAKVRQALFVNFVEKPDCLDNEDDEDNLFLDRILMY